VLVGDAARVVMFGTYVAGEYVWWMVLSRKNVWRLFSNLLPELWCDGVGQVREKKAALAWYVARSVV